MALNQMMVEDGVTETEKITDGGAVIITADSHQAEGIFSWLEFGFVSVSVLGEGTG